MKIFLSYSRRDDIPFSASELGWVSQFKEAINWEFRDGGFSEPYIFFDALSIRGNEDFSEKLKEELEEADIFLAVFSPNWLKSEWCPQELQMFQQRFGGHHDERVFIATRQFVDPKEEHKYFNFRTTFSFFDDKAAKPLIEPAFEISNKPKSPFRTAARPLVAQMDAKLKSLDAIKSNSGAQKPAAVQQPDPEEERAYKVLVAAPTPDLADIGDRLKWELSDNAFQVQEPVKTWAPLDEFEEDFTAKATEANFIIHLVGEMPQKMAADERQYLALKQLELSDAVEPLLRIIWVVPETSNQTKEAKELLDRVRDKDLKKRDRMFQHSTGREAVSAIVELVKQTKPEPKKAGIFFFYAEDDEEPALAVHKTLTEISDRVRTPLIGGTPSERYEYQKREISAAKNVVFYWGHAGDNWFVHNFNELKEFVEDAGAEHVKVLCKGEPASARKEMVVQQFETDLDGVIAEGPDMREGLKNAIKGHGGS